MARGAKKQALLEIAHVLKEQGMTELAAKIEDAVTSQPRTVELPQDVREALLECRNDLALANSELISVTFEMPAEGGGTQTVKVEFAGDSIIATPLLPHLEVQQLPEEYQKEGKRDGVRIRSWLRFAMDHVRQERQDDGKYRYHFRSLDGDECVYVSRLGWRDIGWSSVLLRHFKPLLREQGVDV